MFVDDAVDAALYVLRQDTGKDPINIGVGQDLTIREIADVAMRTIGFKG